MTSILQAAARADRPGNRSRQVSAARQRFALALHRHPRSGASWEGFALEQVLAIAQPDEAYFWATHGGAELDLLMFKQGRRVGVEFKRADAPTMTPSMRHALADLRLDALYVVYPRAALRARGQGGGGAVIRVVLAS